MRSEASPHKEKETVKNRSKNWIFSIVENLRTFFSNWNFMAENIFSLEFTIIQWVSWKKEIFTTNEIVKSFSNNFSIANLRDHYFNTAKWSTHAEKSSMWKQKDGSSKSICGYSKHQVNAFDAVSSLCSKFVNTKIVHFKMEFIFKQLRLKIGFHQAHKWFMLPFKRIQSVWTLAEQFYNFERFSLKV